MRQWRLRLAEIGELGLAPARIRAADLLRQLSLDDACKAFAFQVIRRQRSTDGLVATLAAAVDALESGTVICPPVSRLPLTRLPVWPRPDARSYVAMIPASDVAYAFTVGALTQGFVVADWQLRASRREQRVYLRVNRYRDRDPEGIGVFATPYRMLDELCALLDPARFVPANQSTVVNLAYIDAVEREDPVELTVALADRRETLRASREGWRALKPALGLTARMRGQTALAEASHGMRSRGPLCRRNRPDPAAEGVPRAADDINGPMKGQGHKEIS